jgi:hypothetical protein
MSNQNEAEKRTRDFLATAEVQINQERNLKGIAVCDKLVCDVIQYIRPHGEVKHEIAVLPNEYKELYDSMLAHGCRFEAEVLTTSQVSVTISDPKEELDLDISITFNGPEVQKGMIKMLERKSWMKGANE